MPAVTAPSCIASNASRATALAADAGVEPLAAGCVEGGGDVKNEAWFDDDDDARDREGSGDGRTASTRSCSAL